MKNVNVGIPGAEIPTLTVCKMYHLNTQSFVRTMVASYSQRILSSDMCLCVVLPTPAGAFMLFDFQKSLILLV